MLSTNEPFSLRINNSEILSKKINYVIENEKINKEKINFSKKRQKPLLVGGNGGPYTAKMSRLIEKHRIPVYDDLRTWVTVASALSNFGNNK